MDSNPSDLDPGQRWRNAWADRAATWRRRIFQGRLSYEKHHHLQLLVDGFVFFTSKNLQNTRFIIFFA